MFEYVFGKLIRRNLLIGRCACKGYHAVHRVNFPHNLRTGAIRPVHICAVNKYSARFQISFFHPFAKRRAKLPYVLRIIDIYARISSVNRFGAERDDAHSVRLGELYSFSHIVAFVDNNTLAAPFGGGLNGLASAFSFEFEKHCRTIKLICSRQKAMHEHISIRVAIVAHDKANHIVIYARRIRRYGRRSVR